jgi:hypothetical protein
MVGYHLHCSIEDGWAGLLRRSGPPVSNPQSRLLSASSVGQVVLASERTASSTAPPRVRYEDLRDRWYLFRQRSERSLDAILSGATRH